MTKLTESQIPELEGTDLTSARKWFSAMASLGIRFHADDPVDDGTLTTEATATVNAVMASLYEGRRAWPDPDFIYDLAGEGSFKVEEDYPGLILDASIPAASRTGYVSMPGHEFPTVAVEEMSQFLAIQIIPGKGPLSECRFFRVIPLEGARFDPEGAAYINTSEATLLFDHAVKADNLGDLEAAVEAAALAMTRAPRV